MRKSIWDKRLPTLLGILLITVATFITSTLVEQGAIFVGKAAPSNVPQNIRITNVSSSSFTVSYLTDAAVFGSLNYGKSIALGQVSLDERDKQVAPHNIHSFTVKNLSPSTKYYFSIISGEETFLNSGLPYEVQTGSQINKDKSKIGFVVGKIVSASGVPPKESIVYLSTGGAQPVSAIAKPDGSYSISLEDLRTENLSSFFEISGNTVFKMLILGDKESSQVSILAKEITNVPTVVLSKNYDFTEDVQVSSVSATLENFPSFPKANSKNITPKITAPTNKQTLSDARPLFRGTAVPGNEVKVVIESEVIEAEILADSNGNWSFRPPSNLPAGEHKISITTRDAFGVLRTITHIFTVQVAEAATPSPTPTPTPTPLASGTPSPTPTPVAVVAPTATPISIIPTPTPVELPEVGSPPAIGAIFVIVKNLIGGMLFIISRGAVSL